VDSKKSSSKQRKSKKQFASPPPSSLAEITYGKVLDDGCAIDFVVDYATGNSQLFVHTRQTEFVAPEFQFGALVFRPGRIPPTCDRLIHFPERAVDFGSPETLTTFFLPPGSL